MIPDPIVVDTGPLVALLADDDAEHERCVEQSRSLRRPFFTTWPVLTEVSFLLRDSEDSIPRIMGLLESELIVCVELDAAAGRSIAAMARKYADIRPDLADLTLVYVANQLRTETIFSLDRRDFSIYRSRRGRAFDLLPE